MKTFGKMAGLALFVSYELRRSGAGAVRIRRRHVERNDVEWFDVEWFDVEWRHEWVHDRLDGSQQDEEQEEGQGNDQWLHVGRLDVQWQHERPGALSKAKVSSPAERRTAARREWDPGRGHRDGIEYLGSLPLALLAQSSAGNDKWNFSD